ncbi:hypothetical protein CPT_Sonora_088 [Stenotrophomonas phage Sonora]|nr:hypothetical protein CPT_Sonora_088 [Stenotrophomonas phage Sonora]
MSRRYAVEQRLRLIDFLLANYGSVGRPQLMDYFGISTPQASDDLSEYRKLAPNNMVYDATLKAYVAGPEFKRVYP